MPELTTPHMKWPPVFHNVKEGAMEFVEDYSIEDVRQNVIFVLSTAIGEMFDEPSLGIKEPNFKRNGVSEAELLATVYEWEPRANLVFTDDEIINFKQILEAEIGTVQNG